MIEKVKELFSQLVGENEANSITHSTLLNDIEDWDSLTYMELVIRLEKKFQIKLEYQDIIEMNTYGDVEAIVKQKLNENS